VIGTGAADDPWRAKIHGMGVNYVAVIPSKPDGSPALPWCIVKVAATDFSAIDADADIDAWPAVSLDATVAQLPTAARTRIRTALVNRGIDVSDFTGATTLRAVLRRIGRSLEPDFHEDVLDVADVTG
jgi:hypothetical protein